MLLALRRMKNKKIFRGWRDWQAEIAFQRESDAKRKEAEQNAKFSLLQEEKKQVDSQAKDAELSVVDLTTKVSQLTSENSKLDIQLREAISWSEHLTLQQTNMIEAEGQRVERHKHEIMGRVLKRMARRKLWKYWLKWHSSVAHAEKQKILADLQEAEAQLAPLPLIPAQSLQDLGSFEIQQELTRLQNVLTQKLAELAKANEWINNLTLQQMMALDQEQAAAEKRSVQVMSRTLKRIEHLNVYRAWQDWKFAAHSMSKAHVSSRSHVDFFEAQILEVNTLVGDLESRTIPKLTLGISFNEELRLLAILKAFIQKARIFLLATKTCPPSWIGASVKTKYGPGVITAGELFLQCFFFLSFYSNIS